jgi:hypothetical protein
VDFQSLLEPEPEVVAVTAALIVAPGETVTVDALFSVADILPIEAKAETDKLENKITERNANRNIFLFTKLLI